MRWKDSCSSRTCRAAAGVSALVVALAGAGVRADDFDGPPIHYGSAPLDDPVVRLAARLARGEVTLAFDERFGYLPAVLEALGIPVSSQGLVVSKTSFQQSQIGPRRPRAVYFGDSTERRIAHVAEELVTYLLFSGEAELEAPVRGTTSFAEELAARGPRDRRGRSLRDFDLVRRLFRYPLSYLIYSESFAALPGAVRDVVLGRLGEVLSGADRSEAFGHLTTEDRRAIREILVETLDDVPESWKTRRRL